MNPDDRDRMVTRFLAAWTSQDVERVLDCYTHDLRYHDPNTRGDVNGRDAMRRYLTRLFAAWQMTSRFARAPLPWRDPAGTCIVGDPDAAGRADLLPSRSRALARARDSLVHCRGSTEMNLIISLIIGGIVGWLASIVMKTNAQMGWIANVLVGVVGAAIGFWIAGALGIAAGGGILRFLVALAGAILLIVILRALGVFKKA